MDLFSELINSDVRRRADEDLTRIHLGEVINNRSRGNGFASARRSLDQTDGLLKDALNSIHLGVVELWQTRGGKALGHLGTKNLRLKLVTKELVVLFVVSQVQATRELSKDTHNVTTNALLVDGKCLHGKLHSIEAGRFPYKVCGKALRDLVWYTFGPTQLKTNFV